jgi:hypothetical protein
MRRNAMEWKRATQIEGGVKIPERWILLHYYEAFNVLFRIENALRIFVYIVLKNEFRERWAEAQVVGDDEHGTIASLAKKRMGQAQTFGYLGHPIACPIMHLNSGELTRLIVSECYWRLFKPYFLGSKDIIKNKLDEAGSIRNSLAHFRPVRRDDVEVIKQNSKQFLLGIEQFLKQALVQRDVVPTNTTENWFRSLNKLGTDHCQFTFHQSADEKWIRVRMAYACPTIQREFLWDEYRQYTILTVRSSAILARYPEIARDICYLSETVRSPSMQEDGDAEFGKGISFVLSRSMLESQHEELKKAFEQLLHAIGEETDLIQQDHLARGQLVHSVVASASLLKEKESARWQWFHSQLRTPVVENDPPEYWGSLLISGGEDFVSATDEYPWMPEAVSGTEFPF